MTTPAEPHTLIFSHVNGSVDELLDRLAVAELCKGWPVYRDASEWMNFRSLFADEAYVWTTWSGPQTIDNFIELSKTGKSTGSFIQHRECGTLVELNTSANRAVGKMKATITQRFTAPSRSEDSNSVNGVNGTSEEAGEYDVDCDCRFLFFCEREATDGSQSRGIWKAKYVKLIYEKDRVIPASGGKPPRFDQAILDSLPEGYKYLGAAQHTLGYEIDPNLVTVRDVASYNRMYESMEKWLVGKDADLFW